MDDLAVDQDRIRSVPDMVSCLRLEVAMRTVATSTTEAQTWTGIILSDEVAPDRSHWLTWLNGEQQSLTQSREAGSCHEGAFRY